MRYFLIKEKNSDIFNQKIYERLEEGWQLHGETFVYKIDENVFYTQAVIKNEIVKSGGPPIVDDSVAQIIASWNC